jgi:hypothetical protein
VRDRGPVSSVVSVFRVVPSTRSSGRQGAPSCPSSPPAHYLRVAVHPRARPRPPTHPRHPPRATARQHSTRRARRDKSLFHPSLLVLWPSLPTSPPIRLPAYPPTRPLALTRLHPLTCTNPRSKQSRPPLPQPQNPACSAAQHHVLNTAHNTARPPRSA